MLRRTSLSVFVVVLMVGALGACTDARKTLGLDKTAPDEFAVVSRAPLEVPPDFRLRPPKPGAKRPQEPTTAETARAAMTGYSRPASRQAGVTPGAAALLAKAGADEALPGIRQIVDKETSTLAAEEKSFTERLVFWRDSDPTGTVVDAEKEARRIQQNQALGKSVSEGETPKIKRERRGMLEGIF